MLKDQKGNWEREFERGKDREEENRNGLGEDNWESLIYGENTEKPRKRKHDERAMKDQKGIRRSYYIEPPTIKWRRSQEETIKCSNSSSWWIKGSKKLFLQVTTESSLTRWAGSQWLEKSCSCAFICLFVCGIVLQNGGTFNYGWWYF